MGITREQLIDEVADIIRGDLKDAGHTELSIRDLSEHLVDALLDELGITLAPIIGEAK